MESKPKVKRSKRDNNSFSNFKISIDNFDIYEKERLINTPRSILACKYEGIQPKDLLYKPIEDFENVSSQPGVQKLHYEFFENKRKNLIKQIQQAKKHLIQNEIQQSTFTTQLDRYAEISLNNTPSAFKTTDTTISRAQQKQLKLIENMLRNQEIQHKKFEEQQKQNELREQKIKEEQDRQIEIEKKKLEEQRIRDIKKKQLQEKEELEKKKAKYQLNKKDIEEQKKIEEIENKRFNTQLEKKQINEKKRIQQELRSNENLQKIEFQRTQKQEQKQKKEQDLFQKTEGKKQMKIQELQQKRQKNEEKRQFVIQMQQKKTEDKIMDFKTKQFILDQKYLKILEGREMKKNELVEQSKDRNDKIQLTLKQAEEQLEQRKDEILKKREEAEKKLEEQKKKQNEKMIFLKAKKKLSEIDKYQNQIRQRKKDQFKKQMKIKKAISMNKKIEFFKQNKEKIMSERVKTNTDGMLQRVKIKDALNQMAITNKWNINEVRNLFSQTPAIDQRKCVSGWQSPTSITDLSFKQKLSR